MCPSLARQYQSAETHLLGAASSLDRALEALRGLPLDTTVRLALMRTLRAAHALERACDALEDRVEDAGQALCPVDDLDIAF